MAKGGVGSHERTIEGETNDWLTPPWITEALGPFDMDPCASANRSWDIARINISPPANGLRVPWRGTIWLNPPYGRETWDWLTRLADARDNNQAVGIALIFARTETIGFQASIWERANAILFIDGRLKFWRPGVGEDKRSNAGAPSALVAYGEDMVNRLRESGIAGRLVTSWTRVEANGSN